MPQKRYAARGAEDRIDLGERYSGSWFTLNTQARTLSYARLVQTKSQSIIARIFRMG